MIRTGRRDEQEDVVAVLDGLDPGDRVVVAGAYELKAEMIAEGESRTSVLGRDAVTGAGPGSARLTRETHRRWSNA